MLTKKNMKELDEAQLRTEIIIPILSAMGYQDIFEYHGGQLEQGKDIVCWKSNDLGCRENLAIVVKAMKISGQARACRGSASEVATQVSQCFGKPFLDKKTGKEQFVDKCWIVSNHEITKEAQDSIKNAISATRLERLTSFVDHESLWCLIEQHMPNSVIFQNLVQVRKILDTVDTHFRPEIHDTSSGIEISLAEKFPGASAERPLQIKPTFEFPGTPEGNKAKADLENFIAKGTSAQIPSDFVKSVEFPDFLQSILGIPRKGNWNINIGSAQSSAGFSARFELASNDGDSFVLERVDFHLSQAGQQEVTLSCEKKIDPICTKLTINRSEKTASLSFMLNEEANNANQFLNQLKWLKCISKPCIMRVFHYDTGILFCEVSQEVGLGDAPNPYFIATIEDLVKIQKKVRRPIAIPRRDLTQEELTTIRKLRTILREGKVSVEWSGLTLSLTRTGVEKALELFTGGKPDSISFQLEETACLFGAELPMGRVTCHCNAALLCDEVQVRERLSEDNRESAFELRFVPGDANIVTMQYEDWPPA